MTGGLRSRSIKLLCASLFFLTTFLLYIYHQTSLAHEKNLGSKHRVLRHSNKRVKSVQTKVFYHHVGEPCQGNNKRRYFKYLLKYWKEFADRHHVPYVISFGSLLGQYRDGNVIPWDEDIDVMVNSSFYHLLHTFSDRRNFKQGDDYKFRLIVHPEFETKQEDDRRRWNCEGKDVLKQVDSCSFRMPLARLVYRYYHLDVFYYYGEGELFNIVGEKQLFYRKDLYPFVRCTFIDVSTWCPSKSKNILKSLYGSIEPHYTCKDGQWVSIKLQ